MKGVSALLAAVDVLQHAAVAAKLVVADGAEQEHQRREKASHPAEQVPEETLSRMVMKFVREFDAFGNVNYGSSEVHM